MKFDVEVNRVAGFCQVSLGLAKGIAGTAYSVTG